MVRFWFSLRELAREQLSELDRIMVDLVAGRDSLLPISRDELLVKMQTGEVVVVDVRPEAEYKAAHIPGSLSIPVEQLEARLAAIPSGKQVVAYCRGPYCLLSVDAVEVLRSRGIPAVRLEDGVPEWRAAGLPLQTA